jgi:histidyl-tRNA synthetase
MEADGPRIADSLRDRVPALRLVMNCGGGSLKTQLKRADRSGADIALIIGDEERERGEITVKRLREDLPQDRIALGDLPSYLTGALGLA